MRAFAWRYLIALVLAVVLTGTAVATVDREINERVADIKRVALAVAEPPPQGANYLIIGSDTREFVEQPRSTPARSAIPRAPRRAARTPTR